MGNCGIKKYVYALGERKKELPCWIRLAPFSTPDRAKKCRQAVLSQSGGFRLRRVEASLFSLFVLKSGSPSGTARQRGLRCFVLTRIMLDQVALSVK